MGFASYSAFFGDQGVEKHKRQHHLVASWVQKQLKWHRASVSGLIVVEHSYCTCLVRKNLGLMLVLKRYERNACLSMGLGS